VTQPTGAVYDRGYRPYDGERGGRGDARLALGRLSVRRALGLRRSWRQKLFPWGLLTIAVIPAVVNVGVKYLTRDSPAEDFEFITYRSYIGAPLALLLFVALTAPDVVCPDRRNRVLPLIFARPLTGADYALTKIASIAAIIFGFGFIPHVVLFVGQMLVSSDGALSYARENAEVIWQVPISVGLQAVHYAAIGVALATFTARRIVASVAFLALLLVTSTVAGVMYEVSDGPTLWSLTSVLRMPMHLRDLVFLGHVDPEGPIGGLPGAGSFAVATYAATLGLAVWASIRRYRTVQL
jgi:ABC-2 type transport system permease protein